MVKYATSIMHNCWFFSQPSNTDAQVHVILTSTNNHYIIGLCKSQLACQFCIKITFRLCCSQAIVRIDVSIMETWHTTFLYVSPNKSPSRGDTCHLAQLLPFYIVPSFE